MANEFSTAGVVLKYAVELTAGTRPTAGYTPIPNVKSTPDMSGAPDTLEVTDLSDTVWKRYIAGLKDPGDTIEFTANLTSALKTAWQDPSTGLIKKYTDGMGANPSLATWFEIAVPGFASFYFVGEPIELGINAMDVNSVAEISLYIIPNGVHGWDTAST